MNDAKMNIYLLSAGVISLESMMTQITNGSIMTEVVILVISTTLLFLWLISLRTKAAELRRPRLVETGHAEHQQEYRESDQHSA